MARSAPHSVVTVLAAASAALAAAVQRQRCRKKALKCQGEARGLASRCDEACEVFMAWVLENSTLLVIAGLLSWSELFPPRNRRRPLLTMLRHATLSVLAAEVTWLIQWVYTDKVYREVPYFAPVHQRPHPTLTEMVHGWVRVFIPSRIVNGLMAVGQIHGIGEEDFDNLVQGVFAARSQGPLSFLLQFIVARGLFDLSFWASHRMIHSPGVYSLVHKKHREHHEPTVVTNNHFTVSDLVIEAVVPPTFAMAGLIAMEKRGFQLTFLQRNYILYSFAWYLGCSHAGKPMPIATVCPPLSFLPFLDRMLGGGVAHHHAHHRFTNCNYGIASWPDKLFGTFRPLQKELPPERDAGP